MNGIAKVIYLVLTIYAWLIVARMLLSWVSRAPEAPRTRSTRSWST